MEWLALRLTAEGYKVWCDRLELLGGESYPKDIDVAIKNRTFRVLGVLSRNSLHKPNPLKERTLALNLAKERKEDFLIPLNLDGLSPTDLDWMVSDLTFVPFHLSWANGLAQLLKLLDRAKAPRDFPNGRSAAATWFEARELVTKKHERLWTNVARIVELPVDIYRYETQATISDKEWVEIRKVWPHCREGQILWSFVSPPSSLFSKYDLRERGKISDWQSARSIDVDVTQTVARVFNDSLRSHCLARGLELVPDGSHCYFPDALLPKNRLSFQCYDDSQTWVRTVGVRNFRTSTGTESCRYHLAPYMRVWLDHELGNLLQIRLRLFLTTLTGAPLEEQPALRRRKAICRNWWNYHWLARTLAVLQFLAGNATVIEIGKSDSQKLVIAKQPLSGGIEWSLDESLLERSEPESEASDAAIVDLEEEPRNETTDEGDGTADERNE